MLPSLPLQMNDSNRSHEKSIKDVLTDSGYAIETIIEHGKMSKILGATYRPELRKVPPAVDPPCALLEAVLKNGGPTENLKVVCKVTTCEEARNKRFLNREAEIWKELKHENIIRVFETFDLPQGNCIVMERAEEGDLLEHIRRQRSGFLQESEARSIFRQILDAVEYLRTERDVAHRDLKCENVFMVTDTHVKLGDFGFCRNCRDPTTGNKVLSETFCGSVPYVAPEILEGKPYNPNYSDIWSLGVILYVMLYGNMPLSDANVLQLLKKAKEQDIFFPEEPEVAGSAIELMLSMMQPDVLSRRTLGNVARSSWVQNEEDDSSLRSSGSSGQTPPERRTNAPSLIQRKNSPDSLHLDSGICSLDMDNRWRHREDELYCGTETEGATAAAMPNNGHLMSNGGHGDLMTPQGDHLVREQPEKDWLLFEWSREMDRRLSSSTNSDESATK